MNINISTVSSGWILQKIAERTANAGNKLNRNCSISVSHSANFSSDVNIYMDIQNCYFGQKTKLDIGFFTHADMNSENWLFNLLLEKNVYQNMDGIISMNERYTEMLRKIGIPNEKLITLTPGQTFDIFPLKKIKIGIVSRGGYEGYGHYFIENLFKSKNLENFEFHFLGNGWESLLPLCNEKNITIKIQSDSDYSIYPNFYKNIDYLLIPGLWTAGPISFQEALSTGTPVISSNVGFANYEFKPDYIFEPNNVEELYSILNVIKEPIINRRKQVEKMTWEGFASDVIDFIYKIKKTK
jgi:glycosyltransferase involved in cell wall biosynthesis